MELKQEKAVSEEHGRSKLDRDFDEISKLRKEAEELKYLLADDRKNFEN